MATGFEGSLNQIAITDCIYLLADKVLYVAMFNGLKEPFTQLSTR